MSTDQILESSVEQVLKPKNTGGRPTKASQVAALRTVEGRIKLLCKVAYSQKSKPSDIIGAIKEITDLLGDRLKQQDRANPEVTIRFEETAPKPAVTPPVTMPELMPPVIIIPPAIPPVRPSASDSEGTLSVDLQIDKDAPEPDLS